MTPDPGGRKVVKLDNPQTWNMYAYVTDNPTTLNDPSGLQAVCTNRKANVCNPQGQNAHPVHEAGFVQKFAPGPQGNGGKVEMTYAKAQNTSGKGEIGGKVGAGAVDVTVTAGAGGPGQGSVNIQSLTANLGGKAGRHGVSVSAGARVLKFGSQTTFPVEGWKVTVTSSVSALGVGGNAHLTLVNRKFSIGGGLTVGFYGAGLSITVAPPEPPDPAR